VRDLTADRETMADMEAMMVLSGRAPAFEQFAYARNAEYRAAIDAAKARRRREAEQREHERGVRGLRAMASGSRKRA